LERLFPPRFEGVNGRTLVFDRFFKNSALPIAQHLLAAFSIWLACFSGKYPLNKLL
jgi:hypothetical protein